MHIVCSHCFAINRLDADRLGEHPLCGTCGSPLLTGEPANLDERHFATFVGRNDLPVVVDFWANWCGPCHAMTPQFAAAAKLLTGSVMFAKVETDHAQRISAQYQIRSIPTVILFLNGVESSRRTGAMSSQQITQWVRSVQPR
ncbi:thioredoxin TrxC [Burkholderia thailandensis]|uniref:Thioredoxin n=1 Tax=Burkholderia thailandensis (strain ATCC 700388 / DSM 13276 / CCUG 48851 / CIP 106301 / E264) TaxID=271848 RepID=Q2T993_BURTA|nr:thioredoxin TrxC [Burkholderia thailandensis]ABC34187.1 thioredoxin, putative [Burkholderia thailandensis E264]AHI67674.1 thioredoxin [Burkholderia thailandensis H0587]AHI74894.1 thioredoxin [Burkholderia thailandensis 2002721723]AHI82678.1 thioredoxin [Burkholderia thailandensis E444]AIC90386.1 thioredoxin [Burkholderia thailandensis USAMRU Malaysia \